MKMEKSYEQLLDDPEHWRRMQKIAQKYTRNTALDWKDAVHEAYVKLLYATRAGKFRDGEPEQFYHWAARVAQRAIIDYIRREQPKQRHIQSLDQCIPGTDLPLSETVASELDVLSEIEWADLVRQAQAAIATLDRRHPERSYGKLWQGLVQEKTQSQLAMELQISQGEISKRWRELRERIAQELGLLPTRKRSDAKW